MFIGKASLLIKELTIKKLQDTRVKEIGLKRQVKRLEEKDRLSPSDKQISRDRGTEWFNNGSFREVYKITAS